MRPGRPGQEDYPREGASSRGPGSPPATRAHVASTAAKSQPPQLQVRERAGSSLGDVAPRVVAHLPQEVKRERLRSPPGEELIEQRIAVLPGEASPNGAHVLGG